MYKERVKTDISSIMDWALPESILNSPNRLPRAERSRLERGEMTEVIACCLADCVSLLFLNSRSNCIATLRHGTDNLISGR